MGGVSLLTGQCHPSFLGELLLVNPATSTKTLADEESVLLAEDVSPVEIPRRRMSHNFVAFRSQCEPYLFSQ